MESWFRLAQGQGQDAPGTELSGRGQQRLDQEETEDQDGSDSLLGSKSGNNGWVQTHKLTLYHLPDLTLSTQISSCVPRYSGPAPRRVFHVNNGFQVKDFSHNRIFLKHRLTQSSYRHQKCPPSPCPSLSAILHLRKSAIICGSDKKQKGKPPGLYRHRKPFPGRAVGPGNRWTSIRSFNKY